jgi:hypothetical protein
VQSPGAIWLPETTGAVVDVLVALWEGRPDNAGEAAVQTLRGRRLDVAYTVVFEGARGERALVSLLDISDRKTAQRLIEKQASRLETLNRVARAIGSDLDLERIVQTLTNAATDVAGARFGAFFYNSADQGSEGYTLFALSGAPSRASECRGTRRCSTPPSAAWESSAPTTSGPIPATAARGRTSACRRATCRW